MKEINFCNLVVSHNNKRVTIKAVVYKATDGFYRNKRELKKYGITTDVAVLSVEIIKFLGFENPPIEK